MTRIQLIFIYALTVTSLFADTESMNSEVLYEMLLQNAYEESIQPIPEDFKEENEVSLILVSIKKSEFHRGGEGQFILINPTNHSISFTGYSINDPWYYWKEKKGKKWNDLDTGLFCGTGLQSWKVPPGKSTVMSMPMPREINKRDIKVGLKIFYLDQEERIVHEVYTETIQKGANKT